MSYLKKITKAYKKAPLIISVVLFNLLFQIGCSSVSTKPNQNNYNQLLDNSGISLTQDNSDSASRIKRHKLEETEPMSTDFEDIDLIYTDSEDEELGEIKTITTGDYFEYVEDASTNVEVDDLITVDYETIRQEWLVYLKAKDYKLAFVRMYQNLNQVPKSKQLEFEKDMWAAVKRISRQDEIFIEQKFGAKVKRYLNKWLDLKTVAYSGMFFENFSRWQNYYLNASPQISANFLDIVTNLYSSYKPVKKVAVFLPLSGTYQVIGETIQEGLIEASRIDATEGLRINFYDSAEPENIRTSLNNEIANGVDFVVGPVLKSSISYLGLNEFNSHLLLNWVDAPVNGYQFSLGMESETTQLLDWLIKDKKERLLVITNRDNLKIAESIKDSWETNERKKAEIYILKSIANARMFIDKIVGISASKKRHQLVNSILKIDSNAEYLPRKDKDAVVSLLNLKEQSVLQPQLKFSGVNWPVYATSKLATTEQNKDLIGLRVLSPNYLFDDNFEKSKLFAFGWDAWQLVNNVAYMLPNNKYDTTEGIRGDMWLSATRKVQISLQPARYKRDGLQPIKLN